MLLLATAVLKIQGWGSFSTVGVSWYANPILQGLAIEWELILGCWLISGKYRIGAWIASLVTFGGFALWSFYLGWIGEASCGCFGRIEASPWLAFGLDAVVLLALGIFHPDISHLKRLSPSAIRRVMLRLGGVALGSTCLIGLLALVAVAKFGSIQAAVAQLRGEPISINPSFVDFGKGAPGDELENTIEVGNWSGKELRLIGGTTDCSFYAAESLPLKIQPGATAAVVLKLKVPQAESSGAFRRYAELWTDSDAVPTLRFPVGCEIRSP